ncbi:MAG: 1-acyl-sn-glycerol-3-phosphate acyltransferase [Treponema sp.]|jgi:1-acyl-sn-glycerol-3-phosphate acyltransferase|nr:1-acyl-sn-glycerol-3-phosphate acyltransferase [Treponema sp.]
MKEPYVPQMGIIYPEEPDAHMVEPVFLRDVKVDENYPFLDKSLKFRFIRFWLYIGIYTAAFFVCHIWYGIKVTGRENLRKHKKLFKDGAMTVCNHVQRYDFIFTQYAVRYHKMFFPVWKEHLKGPDAGLIRHAGGIPVPYEISIIKHFNKAFDEVHDKKIWLHAYPESTRFDYFVPIRPFKKGVFTMAHRYNLPVIPIAITFRKQHFPYIHALMNKHPLITVNIGEPVLIDQALDRKTAVAKLRKDCHEAMVRLAGITNNPYPPEGD